ncbi:MAG: hypothetical protein JWQ06_1877 [Mucilaginibacter sp.]|nr:hypothetical protein [Mucilaginibacter sp.]
MIVLQSDPAMHIIFMLIPCKYKNNYLIKPLCTVWEKYNQK